MSSTTTKTLRFLYCLLWTCTRQSSQCFFFFMLEKNPEYLKQLVTQSRQPNSPISVIPKSLTNQPDTGIPMTPSAFNNVPILIPTNSALLPDEIMYNGRKWKKTTRGNILMNNGLNYLKKGVSTLTDSLPQPSLQNVSVTFPEKKNGSEKLKKIEITKNGNGDAEKVDEYTSSSEDDDDDDDDSSDGDNDDDNDGSRDSTDDGSKKVNDNDDRGSAEDISDVYDDDFEDGKK